MKRLSFLAMFIAMILGASAQHYMHVWSDGAWVSWPVLNVDSITFTDGPLENVPDEPQEPTPIVGAFSVGRVRRLLSLLEICSITQRMMSGVLLRISGIM